MAKERNGTSENEPLASSTDEAEVRPRRSRGRRERGVRIQEASRIREPGITDPNEVEQFKRSSDNKNSKMTLLGVTSAFNLVQKVSDRIAIQKKQEHPLKRRATRRARSGSVRRTGSRNRRQGSVRSRESSTGFDRSSSIRSRPNGLGRRQKLSCDSENNKSETQKLHSKRDVETGSSEVFLPKPPEKSVKDQIYNIFSNGWRQIQSIVVGKPEEIITVQEIIKEPILEDLDLPHRYRPENLQLLCEATGFSIVEMKRIYRGFKTECPTGLITEEAFHGIYSRFFPQGAQFIWSDIHGKSRSSVKPPNIKMSKKERKEVQNSQANVSSYSHYVFSTLDHEDSGIITFEDFVIGLSILVRGTTEEKVRWMFSLYDQDRDGFISREEMEDVVGSVFDLMGRTSDPILEEEVINARVDYIFERMDLNGDGVVSQDEFLETCLADGDITNSIVAFSNVII